MANEQNLRPIKLTHEEAVKNGKKGGLKSVESRRAIKTFKQAFEEELDDNKIKELINAMYKRATKGDTKAFELIRDTMGQKPKESLQVDGKINNPFSGLTTEELRKMIDARKS